MSENLGTISVFHAPDPGSICDVIAIAIDEDGEVVASKICSGPFWAKQDLVNSPSEFCQWFYNDRYPQGYRLNWFGEYIPPHWGGETDITDENLQRYHRAHNTGHWQCLVKHDQNVIPVEAS